MHVLALSGLHIGIVYVVIAFLLGFLNKTQKQKVIKSLIIMLSLWAFAFLTGLSASVIRATLMFTFITIATSIKRKSQIYNTIFMSMLFMLLINPNYLYNVGYQLSYAAVLSIIFFKPVLNKIYNPTNKFTRFSWSTFSVSLAAQVGTAPFTLYYFQQFPNYFLVSNFIAIPITTIIIYLAIGLFFSSFVPYIPVWIAFLLTRTVWLLNYVMSTIQNLPYSVSHISLDIRQSFVLFLAIFCFSAYYFNKKVAPLMIGLASLLLTCIINIQLNYHTLVTKRMIVYAGMKNTHVSFINGNKNYVFTTDSLEIKKIAKSFWQNQKLEATEYLHKNNWFNDGFACFEDSKILILTQDYLNKQNSNTPLELDYLVIGNKLKPKMEQILQCVHPREIIIDNSISKWHTENIKQFCISRKIKYYSIAEKGAYIQYIKD
jgi:competence protein ComEC